MTTDAFADKLTSLLAHQVTMFLNVQEPEKLANRAEVEDSRREAAAQAVLKAVAAINLPIRMKLSADVKKRKPKTKMDRLVAYAVESIPRGSIMSICQIASRIGATTDEMPSVIQRLRRECKIAIDGHHGHVLLWKFI